MLYVCPQAPSARLAPGLIKALVTFHGGLLGSISSGRSSEHTKSAGSSACVSYSVILMAAPVYAWFKLEQFVSERQSHGTTPHVPIPSVMLQSCQWRCNVTVLTYSVVIITHGQISSYTHLLFTPVTINMSPPQSARTCMYARPTSRNCRPHARGTNTCCSPANSQRRYITC